jgi:VanZ family protein
MKRRWVWAGLYAAVIVAIIVIADGRATYRWLRPIRALPYGDKIAHFCLMGGLSFVVNWALDGRRVAWGRWRFLMGSLLVAALVALEEFSQLFIRYRTFDVDDLAADFAGIFLFGRLALWLAERRFR